MGTRVWRRVSVDVLSIRRHGDPCAPHSSESSLGRLSAWLGLFSFAWVPRTPDNVDMVFVCGPPPMYDAISGYVRACASSLGRGRGLAHGELIQAAMALSGTRVSIRHAGCSCRFRPVHNGSWNSLDLYSPTTHRSQAQGLRKRPAPRAGAAVGCPAGTRVRRVVCLQVLTMDDNWLNTNTAMMKAR
jgi:hypothetical protein